MRLIDLGNEFFVEARHGGARALTERWIAYRRRDSKMRRSGMYLPLSTAASREHTVAALLKAGAPDTTMAAFQALLHGEQAPATDDTGRLAPEAVRA